MRFIPTMLHGVADYIVGAVVIALPFYFGWDTMVRSVFIVLGAAVILYSLMTDYELGLVRYLRIRFHLLFDGIFGLAMLAAPALLHIPSSNRGVIYTIGIVALLLAFTTKIRAYGTHPEANS